MGKLTGYANYGVLAHEKQIIFTVDNKHPHAAVSDKIEMIIPDDFAVSASVSGDILIDTPDGTTYSPKDIISSWGDKPALIWFDGERNHRQTLEWEKI